MLDDEIKDKVFDFVRLFFKIYNVVMSKKVNVDYGTEIHLRNG